MSVREVIQLADFVATERPVTRIVVIADRIGATQQISFMQPLAGQLTEQRATLLMVNDKIIGRTHAKASEFLARHSPTAVIFSRYTEGRCKDLISIARERRIPILFHIDDDLLDPPPSLGNTKYEHYSNPTRIAALRAAMNEADLVYASTPQLANALLRHGVTAPILAGEVYCSVDVTRLPPVLPSTLPVFGYMGTEGHAQDLAMVLPAIERVMTEIPGLRFETFGTIVMPPSLEQRFGIRVRHHPPVGDYARFLDRLAEFGWWVGLAPLERTPFNHCKADTKWVEYTYAGIATLASAGPVYARACEGGAGRLAEHPAAWISALGELIRDGATRTTQLAIARERLTTHYSHHVLEAQLLVIVAKARAGLGLAA